MIVSHYATGGTARRVIGHGGPHAGVNQPMLQVTLGRNQHGFAIVVFDPGELDAQIANEIGTVKDVADLASSEFVHLSLSLIVRRGSSPLIF
jgi:hypothetical protein